MFVNHYFQVFHKKFRDGTKSIGRYAGSYANEFHHMSVSDRIFDLLKRVLFLKT